jgi:hypothetical protein
MSKLRCCRFIQTRERALNTAIVQANISESFEEYLEIFKAFTPMTSRQAAKPGKNQFVERGEYARFPSTSLSRFT